jgi:group I intron endonuclease
MADIRTFFVSSGSVDSRTLGCIYLITNILNRKMYVGQHHLPVPDRRWSQHLATSKRGGSNYALYNAMRKHGADNFICETLYTCDQSKLGYYEEFFADLLHTYVWDASPGYNTVRCGSKPRLGVISSEETRRLLSISHIGKTRSRESLDKASKSMRLQRANNPEMWAWASKKTGEKLKGRSNADWGSFTPERNAKISAKLTNVPKSEEHRRNAMRALKPGPLTQWDYISPWRKTGRFLVRITNRTYGKIHATFDTHPEAIAARDAHLCKNAV